MFPEIEHVAKHIRDAYCVPTVMLSSLSNAQKEIFTVLSNYESRSTREVAREIGMNASSVGHLIAKLFEMGAVEFVGTGREQRWRLANATVLER